MRSHDEVFTGGVAVRIEDGQEVSWDASVGQVGARGTVTWLIVGNEESRKL